MKVLVIVAALLALTSAQWVPKKGQEVIQIRSECIKEEGVEGSNLDALKKFEYPNEKPVRCYMKCVAKKLGVWDEKEFRLNADRVTEQVKLDRSKDVVKPEVEKCITLNGDKSDECTLLYRDFKCLIDNNLLKVEELVKT